MENTDTNQPLGQRLREACKGFLTAAEGMYAAYVDGINVQGALGALVGAADMLKDEANTFFQELSPAGEKNADDIIAAAMESTYIRKDDDSPWLRIDVVDDSTPESNEILVHNENTETPCEQTLHADELDPSKVSFMKLVQFKL